MRSLKQAFHIAWQATGPTSVCEMCPLHHLHQLCVQLEGTINNFLHVSPSVSPLPPLLTSPSSPPPTPTHPSPPHQWPLATSNRTFAGDILHEISDQSWILGTYPLTPSLRANPNPAPTPWPKWGEGSHAPRNFSWSEMLISHQLILGLTTTQLQHDSLQKHLTNLSDEELNDFTDKFKVTQALWFPGAADEL